MNPSNLVIVCWMCYPSCHKRNYMGDLKFPSSWQPSPRIFSWLSCRSFDILLTKHVSSFDKGAADTWWHIHVPHWPQCGLLVWKVWAGDLTSSGDTGPQWASTLPASAGSTRSSYGSAVMPCCGRGDWNGSQPGQSYARCRKFDSSKTSASDSRSWGQALSCRVMSWTVSLKHWQIQTRQYWPLGSEPDFQVTVIFKERNSNKGQIG